MPFTVRKFNAQVRDSNTGNMIPAGLLSSDSLEAIENAKQDAIDAIEARAGEIEQDWPDDYSDLSEGVADLKTDLDIIEDSIFIKDSGELRYSRANYRLKTDDSGYSIYNTNYRIDKYVVKAGNVVIVNSDDRFQFQSIESTPTTGNLTRIGETYGSGNYLLVVPDGATYLAVSTPINSTNSTVYYAVSGVKTLLEIARNGFYEYTYITSGTFTRTGEWGNNDKRLRCIDFISVKAGDVIQIENGSLEHAVGIWNGEPSNETIVRIDNTFVDEDETITIEYDGYFITAFKKPNDETITPSEYDGKIKIFDTLIAKNARDIGTLNSSKVNKNGTKEVRFDNLFDSDHNLLYSVASKTVSGSGNYVYETVFEYTGIIRSGDVFTILYDSITGESVLDEDKAFSISTNNDSTRIRQVYKSQIVINDDDILGNANKLKFSLYPAQGTPLSDGSAVYTNVRIVRGTKENMILSGDLGKAVKNTVGIEDNDIPNYYFENGYLDKKVISINKYGIVADEVFAFITDIHWERNAKHSPAILKFLKEKCRIPFVMNGGDMADGILPIAIDAYLAACGEKFYNLIGNHEWMLGSKNKSLYYWLNSYNDNLIGDVYNHRWYIDNVQSKIRYITLMPYKRNDADTEWIIGYDQDQLDWFTAVLNSTPSDYDVILVSHYFKSSGPAGVAGFWDIDPAITTIDSAITAFNANTNKGNVLALLEGHRHWDSLFFTTDGTPVILTTCDKYDISNEPTIEDEVRTLGTINEQAFDIITVNRTNGTINCIRIGAKCQDNVNIDISETGFSFNQIVEERIVHYSAVSVDSATTLTPEITATSWHTTNSSVCTVASGVVTPVATGKAMVYAMSASGEMEVWTIIVS